jgi:hypothetical protein
MMEADCAECTESIDLSGSATCTVCNDPLILDQDGSCVYECSGSSYTATDPETGKEYCIDCVEPCDTCEDADTCLSCLYDYLSLGKCVDPCPAG